MKSRKGTVPTFRMYEPDESEWFAEGRGVSPDIHVLDDPTALARGRDPQLEAFSALIASSNRA